MASTIFHQHPSSLYRLCLAECGERFSFHIMRGILILYLTKHLKFTNHDAYATFASFTALLYVTPLLGGYLADKVFSKKESVILGGIILSIGYFLLYLSHICPLYLALSFVALGNGFFMPNIANCIGDLYLNEQCAGAKDVGYSIFYTALNIGAFLPPFFSTWLILQYGWESAFLCSSVMVAAVTLLLFGYQAPTKRRAFAKQTSFLKVSTYCIAIISSVFLLQSFLEHTVVIGTIINLIGVLLVLTIIKKCNAYTIIERNRLWACLILIISSILFWALVEQSAMSLAIFTEYNVKRNLGNHFTISTLYFFSLNPFFIILLGPLIAKWWQYLQEKNIILNITTKFAAGMIFMGFGFIILPLAISLRNESGQINMLWLMFSYFLQSLGELILAPVGMSMIVEMSPPDMVGLMMGLWYFATSIGYILAGYTAQLTVISNASNNPLITSHLFAHVFAEIGLITLLLGILLLFSISPLKKLMAESLVSA